MLEFLTFATDVPDGDTVKVLWVCAFTLGATITGLAAYIRKLLIDHKDEVKALSEAHALLIKTLGEDHVKAIERVYDALSKEKTERRKEMAGFLKEVIEVANAMAKSVDANTESQKRLSDLIEKWTPEE